MTNAQTKTTNGPKRKGERGAALIMVLLISSLLLVAVSGVLLEASMNTANVTDATAEQQAYYAAESGIQTAIHTLRHNLTPNPLVDTSKPATDIANRIDYLKAARRSISNNCPKSPLNCVDADYADAFDRSVDAGGNPQPVRLSRWMSYNWGPNGGKDAVNKDRIVLGDPSTYSPLNGFAFSASVYDPDNTDGRVKYSVSDNKVLTNNDGTGYKQTVSTTGGYSITYNPPSSQDIDVSSGTGTGASLGSFSISGDMTKIPNPSASPTPTGGAVRFKIVVNVTQPQNNTLVVRGYIVPPGSSLKGASGNCTRTKASILFDSEIYLAFGSRITLNYTSSDIDSPVPGCTVEESGGSCPGTGCNGPYSTYLTGFMVQPKSLVTPVTTAVTVNIPVTITQPEPTRLVVKSVGYGPRGARKELETIIQKSYFDGLGSPSPLLLLGPNCTRPGPDALKPDCISASGAAGSAQWSEFVATGLGNSTALSYSGKDLLLKAFLPPIGVSNDLNLKLVQDARLSSSFKGTVFGSIENVRPEMPKWLQNPANLDQTVALLRDIAKASGTCPPSPCSYYPPGVPPPTKGVYGDLATARGLTFVDGDADISGEGGGIVVVTGQLKFGGAMTYNGLILITGKNGFLKSGAGNGNLAGAMIVAPYDAWSLGSCMQNSTVPDKTNCFLAPQYQNSGGGTGDLQFNSTDVFSSLNGISNLVKGVAEK